MLEGRRSLCALVVTAPLVALALSGCAGGEGGQPAAQAGGAATEELAGQLGGGGGESELKEIFDRETTSEERQELREGLEEGELTEGEHERIEGARERAEQSPAQEGEAGQQAEGEAEGEPAAEGEPQ